jgi:aminoglycoside phosphotransferase (APT) family kinase protein
MSNAAPNTAPNTGRAELNLPDEAFAAVVAAHVPGVTFARASRLTGGVSAEVYRLDCVADGGATRSLVLRIHGPHHNGHPAALEFGILEAVTGLGICAPRALALDESLGLIPYRFLLLDHLEGETAAPADPADSRIVRIAEALAQIHSARVTGLPALPSRDDPRPEVFDYLPKGPAFEALRQGLSRLGDTGHKGAPALLHGDFWPGNLLWRGQDLVGILDWEDAAVGDPLSDVACTALELRYVVGPEGAERFLRAYDSLRPISRHRLALWQIYVAAAGQHSMAAWGLAPAREAHMRATALAVIEDAAALVR